MVKLYFSNLCLAFVKSNNFKSRFSDITLQAVAEKRLWKKIG